MKTDKQVYNKMIEQIDFIFERQFKSEGYIREETGSYICKGFGYFIEDADLNELRLYKWILGLSDKEFDKIWAERKAKHKEAEK